MHKRRDITCRLTHGTEKLACIQSIHRVSKLTTALHNEPATWAHKLPDEAANKIIALGTGLTHVWTEICSFARANGACQCEHAGMRSLPVNCLSMMRY